MDEDLKTRREMKIKVGSLRRTPDIPRLFRHLWLDWRGLEAFAHRDRKM